MLEPQQPDALHQLRISPLENSRHTAGLLTGSLPASSLGGKRGSMARRVAFFVGLAALALAGLAACVPSVLGVEGSGTFVVISDLHFNPFEPPELATALARSAPAAWRAALPAANDQAMLTDTADNHPAPFYFCLTTFAK